MALLLAVAVAPMSAAVEGAATEQGTDAGVDEGGEVTQLVEAEIADDEVVDAATALAEADAVLEEPVTALPEDPDISSSQTADHATTQVAIAQTGGNIVGSSSQAPASTQAAAPGNGSSGPSVVVVTGDARSTGSTDSTRIHQQVVAHVSEDGEVEVVQIALVINIGVGVANTGANTTAVGSGGAGGSRSAASSGDGRAVGNDSATYLTQAAHLDADDETEVAEQVATSRTIGIAITNTGLNLVFGEVVLNEPGTTAVEVTTNGTATVQTGLARATGNRSTTAIGQTAVVDAGEGGMVTVVQRAVVTNVGFAVANSGGNGVSGAPGSPELAALWLMIAALLGEDGFDPVSGLPTGGGASVSTGTVDAQGNRSTTMVSQTVIASAERGVAAARQSALVSNTGLALANSGLNNVGNPSGSSSGLAELSDISAELARFLDALINPTADGLPTLSQNLRIGSLGIDLSGVMSSADLLLTDEEQTGDDLGARIRIRQVTGTITIALSVANTGHNSTTTSSYLVVGTDARTQASELLATSVSTLETGDAFALNQSVSVICQRYNADSELCLVPPVIDVTVAAAPARTLPLPATPPAVPAVLPAVVQEEEDTVVEATIVARSSGRAVIGELPRTGSEPLYLVRLAVALLSLGGATTMLGRQRPARSTSGSR